MLKHYILISCLFYQSVFQAACQERNTQEKQSKLVSVAVAGGSDLRITIEPGLGNELSNEHKEYESFPSTPLIQRSRRGSGTSIVGLEKKPDLCLIASAAGSVCCSLVVGGIIYAATRGI